MGTILAALKAIPLIASSIKELVGLYKQAQIASIRKNSQEREQAIKDAVFKVKAAKTEDEIGKALDDLYDSSHK